MMVSTKAIAAIALTMMVVVPIGLGYALSFEETERTVWTVDKSVPVSDLMLNDSTDYYLDYTGTLNNSQIIQVLQLGAHETSLVSPDYVSVGDTYTSMPQFEAVTGAYTLGNRSTQAYNLNSSSVGTVDATYVVSATDLMQIYVNSSASNVHWQLDLFNNGSVTTLMTKSSAYMLRTSDTEWACLVDGNTYTITGWKLATDADGSVTVGRVGFTQINVDSSYVFDLTTNATLKLAHTDGTYEYVTVTDGAAVSWSVSGSAHVGDKSFRNVDRISVAAAYGTSTIYYSTTGAITGYADPAQGWTTPNQVANMFWTNGFELQEVTLYVDVPAGSFTALTMMDNTENLAFVQISVSAEGVASVIFDDAEAQTLGNYSKFKVVFSEENISVFGLMTWPTLGYAASEFNHLDLAGSFGSFDRIKLGDNHDVKHRVDGAKILAGSYPITKDFTLTLSDYYGSESYEMKLTSIGVYGDTIRLNGNNYNVVGGKIVIDGKTVALKGARITSKLDGSTNEFNNEINGVSVGTSASPMAIYFSGVWSLTASANLVSESTDKSISEWKAGGFGLDKDGFIAAGLLTACGTFVFLGMTGKASGTKIGLLALVCGGAAIILFMMI